MCGARRQSVRTLLSSSQLIFFFFLSAPSSSEACIQLCYCACHGGRGVTAWHGAGARSTTLRNSLSLYNEQSGSSRAAWLVLRRHKSLVIVKSPNTTTKSCCVFNIFSEETCRKADCSVSRPELKGDKDRKLLQTCNQRRLQRGSNIKGPIIYPWSHLLSFHAGGTTSHDELSNRNTWSTPLRWALLIFGIWLTGMWHILNIMEKHVYMSQLMDPNKHARSQLQ